MSLGKEYQKGKTKIFIRQPESVFSLEELRDRTVFSYANKIQRFLRKTSMAKYVQSPPPSSITQSSRLEAFVY
jgi:myosin heavy subunit